MAIKWANRARMGTATTGTGTITLGTAVSGYQSFADAGIANGDEVYYTIEDGSDWEIGIGTYASSGTTLSRDTVIESTNTDSQLNLSGSAEVFITAPAAHSFFPSGTRMVFQQTLPPTGWQKEIVHDNKALRLVTGTPGSGGSVAFSTAFGRTATDSHTLTISQIPAHTHDSNVTTSGAGSGTAFVSDDTNRDSQQTGSAGGGLGHTHNIDLRVQYVDFIIRIKD